MNGVIDLVARHQRRESWGRRVARWIIAGRRMTAPLLGVHSPSLVCGEFGCKPALSLRSLGFGGDGSVKYSVRMAHGTLRVVIQPDWRGM